MFQQNISTDNSIYYNHFKKKIHGKGGRVGRGSVYPFGLGVQTATWLLDVFLES